MLLPCLEALEGAKAAKAKLFTAAVPGGTGGAKVDRITVAVDAHSTQTTREMTDTDATNESNKYSGMFPSGGRLATDSEG